MTRTKAKLASILGVTLALGMLAAAPAEARRGGSFGSRGARTFQAPKATRTAPDQAAPVQRSMTPQQKAAQPGAQTANGPTAANPAAGAQAQQPRRGGFLGGMGGGLLAGLAAGGLLGMLMGNGFGGMGGMGAMLMQILLIGGLAMLAMMLFRAFRRPNHAVAGHGQVAAFDRGPSQQQPVSGGFERQEAARSTYSPMTAAQPVAAAGPVVEEIGVTQADRDTFERLLAEVQGAFGREDYAGLRERTTPEIMSYLAEELSQNATQGLRNEVSDVRLLQADIAEAWREDDTEYATAALRYESVDVMRDRLSGDLIPGQSGAPTEAVELWTFVRRPGGEWKLSAIQQA